MQYQADISGIPVLLPQISEITALGVAYMAGLHCGFWTDLQEIEKNWQMKCRFEPNMKDKERKNRLAQWHNAVKATREFKA